MKQLQNAMSDIMFRLALGLQHRKSLLCYSVPNHYFPIIKLTDSRTHPSKLMGWAEPIETVLWFYYHGFCFVSYLRPKSKKIERARIGGASLEKLVLT